MTSEIRHRAHGNVNPDWPHRALPLQVGPDQPSTPKRTRAIVRAALGTRMRESVRAATPPGGDREAIEWALRINTAGDVLNQQRLDGAEDEINLDVTRCGYAEFFDGLGEPELGFLLVSSLDYDIADALDGVSLERPQTIMEGALRCDFRFASTGRTDRPGRRQYAACFRAPAPALHVPRQSGPGGRFGPDDMRWSCDSVLYTLDVCHPRGRRSI